MITQFEPIQRFCLTLEGQRGFIVGKEGVQRIDRNGDIVRVTLDPASLLALRAGAVLVFSPTGVTSETADEGFEPIPDRWVAREVFAPLTARQPEPIPPEVAAQVKPVAGDAVGPPPPPTTVTPGPVWVAPAPSGRVKGRRS